VPEGRPIFSDGIFHDEVELALFQLRRAIHVLESGRSRGPVIDIVAGSLLDAKRTLQGLNERLGA
jgi:hypothetical protein